MGLTRWGDLSLDEAKALGRAWEARRPERLTWLRGQVEQELALDEAGMRAAWEWYLPWSANPTSAATEPSPEWWGEDGWTAYSREEAVGADALGHLFVAAIRQRFPQLITYHPTQGNLKYPLANENEPCLALPGSGGQGIQFEFSLIPFMRAIAEEPHEPSVNEDFLTFRFTHLIGRLEVETGKEGPPQASVPGSNDADDPPRAVDGMFTVEPFDDEDYPWSLEFDDVLAHEDEKRIAMLVEALTNAPGVTEVHHQDRQQVLLAGDISQDAITQWIRDWWEQRPS